MIILGLKTYGMSSPAGKSWLAAPFPHSRKVLPCPQPRQQLPCPTQDNSAPNPASAPWKAEPELKRENEKEVFWQAASPHERIWDGSGGTLWAGGESSRPGAVPGPTFPQQLPSPNPTSWQSPWAAAASQPCRVTTREDFLAFNIFIQLATTFFPPEAKLAPRQIRGRVHYKARNIKRSKRKAKLLVEIKIAWIFFCHGKAELSVLWVILGLRTNSAKVARNRAVDRKIFNFIIIFLSSSNCKTASLEGGERLPKFTDFPTLPGILLIMAQQVHSGKA